MASSTQGLPVAKFDRLTKPEIVGEVKTASSSKCLAIDGAKRPTAMKG